MDYDRGDLARAAAAFQEALSIFAAIGDRGGIAHSFANLAVLATARGRPEVAARLLGATDGVRERLGLLPSALSKRLADERARSAALTALGEVAFAAAGTVGWALPLEEAIALAAAVSVPDAPADAARVRRPALIE